MDIVSTYRLQFHKGFTFRDAAAIVPYLHDLGITHVYASPYLKAVAGSTHGYDVIDHSQFNPEIGTPDDYQQFVGTLKQHGMSHILDTVPNHMGVDTNSNHWWNDVLARGTGSAYANFFDIDWGEFPSRAQLVGKVLLPVLGEPFNQAIDKALLQLKWDNGKPFVAYHDRRFPVDPDSDFDTDLADLLDHQHYRLCHWRVASDEINYRRFFDISSLAALQMQRQEVFNAAHEFTFSLIAQGSVAGLRVDHPDGLLDPKEYFDRLQEKFKAIPNSNGQPLFVSVEKILNGDENLCKDWAVSGTSGYDFLCAVNDLFVDSANESAMTEVYANFTADRTSYADLVYRAKRAVLSAGMSSELTALTSRLDALAQMQMSSRDFTRRQLRDALREVIACFPVYRSYVSSRGVSESDIAVVERAITQAGLRNPKMDPNTLAFVRDSVLLCYPIPETAKKSQLDFAQRFQQLTSPVNAKGIEDCTFYLYNRLISLNEVGGDPGRFGRSCEMLHQYFADRQSHWPLALSSLSTHDTKRSEDVRARINVLSEIPREWGACLSRWKETNAEISQGVHLNDQYLLYQTLLGAWPFSPMDEAQRAAFVKRIAAYMQKAMREAKLRTSWIDPDQKYEATVAHLIENLCDPKKSAAFLADFLPFQSRISQLGLFNSLSQTVLRLTAPGVCDTYQGSELWDLSLVDPDNRRPVDYAVRAKMLADIDGYAPGPMIDGRIKLWTSRQLLRFRREASNLFLHGSYEPLTVSGKHASHLFAFARRIENSCVIVVVPRLLASLAISEQWGVEEWGDTRIALPSACTSRSFKNVLSGVRPLSVTPDRVMYASQIMKDFPVAVLASEN